ncbi:Oxysterol-binding protein- protein 8 [Ataeniobius toweri]|uniref:Oxysterol-binding protein- protein 8 n=2 Tax=Goodeidae TaxID=28758 RepID=A0ABU7AWH3_9TELE|nr:Oxysterol-binding protein- protein 8 [Ataeniobius toweri]
MHHAELREHHAASAAVTYSDDTVLLTPGRMSQRQAKERDKDKEKDKEKEAGLQTPNREHIATPSNLSPGVIYSHGFERVKEDLLPLPLKEDSNSISKSKSETKLYNGSDKDVPASGGKLTKKESLKVQKKNYREEKKRATKELLSTITDPSGIVMADWLKIRGTLKSWTKLWCVLKPGVLLIYKTHKNGQWVGTVLLNACELIERPSKKDGFCFKLFHPLEQSIWAVKVRTPIRIQISI